MILNEMNSDDYVYLRLTEDSKIPNGLIDFPAGTVVRFSIDFLRQRLWKFEVREEFFEREVDNKTFRKTDKFYYVDTELNKNMISTELVPTKQYKSVRAKRDFDIVLPVEYGDLLVMNDWLKVKLSENVPFIRRKMQFMNYRNVAHFNEDFFRNGSMTSSPYISKDTPMGIYFEIFQYQPSDELTSNDGRIICKSGDAVCLQFKEGEEIDFSDPAVSLLFLDQEYVKFLLKTEVLSEEEKIEHFIKDFNGWIPMAERKYYRIHNWIKIKTFNDFMKTGVFEAIRKCIPDLNNIFYNNYNYSNYDDFDFDKDGYLRYVWTSGGIELDHELSKIAEPVSREIGEEHYRHEITMSQLLMEERALKYQAEKYFKAHQARFYKLQRTNPNLDYINFMVQEEAREMETKRVLVRRLTRAINSKIEMERNN